MGNPSKSAQLKFTLDSKSIDAPVEWQDISIEATFDDQAIQPNITSSEFTFVNAEAIQIRDYITNGLNGGVGIFEGIPFNIETFNKDSSKSAFNGFLDLSDNFEDLDSVPKVKAKIMKENGLNSLNTRLSDLTYGYLEEKGVFTNSDYTEIDYQVIRSVNPLEIIISGITIYIMIKELQEIIKNIGKNIAIAAGDTSGGVFGPIGAAIFLALSIAIDVIYAALIIIAVIELVRQLINLLFPPVRQHKTLFWRTALSKVADYLGYTFVSPINELDFIYYLPSNPNLDLEDEKTGLFKKFRGTSKGIPNSQDYGYNCSEMFSLAQKAFNAKFVIVGNELHLRSDNDPFWIKTSTYEMPDVLIEGKKYNTNEFVGDKIITFDWDIKDTWTTDNYTGTAYEIKTDAIKVNNPRAVTLKGQDTITLPVCLGTRKEKTTAIEKVILRLARKADGVVDAYLSKSTLATLVKERTGMLKVSDNNHSKPKLLYIIGDRMPSNHRDLWSAKVLWDQYHIHNSFVDNNYVGQKVIYEDKEIPFGFEDFLKLIDNSYFRNFKGEVSKATKLDWNIASDRATISFWTRKPYTNNLIETKIEPS